MAEEQKTETGGKGDVEKRKLSVGLGFGIVLLPAIFSWFTLRRGHTITARLIAFGWLLITTAIWGATDLKRRTSGPNSSSNSSSSSESVQQGSVIEEKKDKTYSVGERFILGNFAYKINATEFTPSIGKTFGREVSEGGIFYLIEFEIENVGQKTDVVLSSDFKIKDEQGRTFTPSSRATTALSMSGLSDMMLSQLQPGIKKTSVTAFELPFNALEDDLYLVVPKKGLFSSGTVMVDLGSKTKIKEFIDKNQSKKKKKKRRR